MNFTSSHIQPFLTISDSHGKSLSSVNITVNYRIENYSFFGLQWIHNYDPNLSVFSLIQNEPFISLLYSTSYVLFLVGTNSIRNFFAHEAIDHINQVFTIIYSQYPHLTNYKVIVPACIPCFKISKRFPTTLLLMNNINHYNQLLFQLSHKYNFLCFDLCIPSHWLGDDMIHIGYRYRHDFSNLLLTYINGLHISRNLLKTVNKGPSEEIHRRNKKRNLKLKNIRKNYTLVREIPPNLVK